MEDSVGAMDLGGESLELTFYHAQLVTKSFAYMGANDILESLLSYLAQRFASDAISSSLSSLSSSSSSPRSIPNPCFPKGYSEKWNEVVYIGTGEVGRVILIRRIN